MRRARVKLGSFILLMFSAPKVWAVPLAASACEEKTVKLSAAGGPLENIGIQDQDGLGTCFANTASVLLSANLPNHPKVSFLDLALLQASADTKGAAGALTKVNPSSDQPVAAFEFGFVCTAINQAIKRGYVCTQESFPVEANGYIKPSDGELIRSFGQFYDDLRLTSRNEEEAQKRAREAYLALKSGRKVAREKCKHDKVIPNGSHEIPVSEASLHKVASQSLSRFMHEVLEYLENPSNSATDDEKSRYLAFAEKLGVTPDVGLTLTKKLSSSPLGEIESLSFPQTLSPPIKEALTQTILPALLTDSKFQASIKNPRTKIVPTDILNSPEIDLAFDQLIQKLALPTSWKKLLKENTLGDSKYNYIGDYATIVDIDRCIDAVTDDLLYQSTPEELVCANTSSLTEEGILDAAQLADLLPDEHVDMELIDRFYALHPDGLSKGVKADDFYRRGLSGESCTGGSQTALPRGAISMVAMPRCTSKGFPSGSLSQNPYYSHRNGQKLPEMRRLFAKEVSEALDKPDLSDGRPLALDLCGQVFTDLGFDGANAVGGCRSQSTGMHNRHSVTLTGYRNITDENGQCRRQYLIQNSWGEESCRTLGQQYCETPNGGGTWLPEDALIKNLYRISTLQ